jgi:hypothetical protein
LRTFGTQARANLSNTAGEEVKRQKQSEPLTREQFDQEWNDLLHTFLVLSEREFIEGCEMFSGPHPLLQASWRSNDYRYM